MVRDAEPGQRYCIVSLTDNFLGVAHYEDLGWRQVLWGEGPTFAGRQGVTGEPMERMGGVLMTISEEDFQALQAGGIDGSGGQALADRTAALLGKQRVALGWRGEGDSRLGAGVQLIDENTRETVAGSAG